MNIHEEMLLMKYVYFKTDELFAIPTSWTYRLTLVNLISNDYTATEANFTIGW